MSETLHRRPRRAVALLVLAGAAAQPAAAETIDIAWSAEGGFERSAAVAPGKFAEIDLLEVGGPSAPRASGDPGLISAVA